MGVQGTTSEMGRYLILRLNFGTISADGDVQAKFRNYVNRSCKLFSEKYAGQLKRPIEINARNELDTLQDTFGVTELSGHQIYLIVDECDAFMKRLLLKIDTSKPDLGRKQYEMTVSDKERMLRCWGSVIKGGTSGPIARAFFTSVAPQSFADSLSGLDTLIDLTFCPWLQGMLGLTEVDVKQGLQAIQTLSHEERDKYLEVMREHYGGFRFVNTQKDTLFNPRCVLQFLHHLEQHNRPPDNLINPAVSGTMNAVAKSVIANCKARAPDMDLNYALGYVLPEAMGTFQCENVPSFRSAALFCEGTVSESLLSLAFYHGFLTYKHTSDGECVLASPNTAMQMVYRRTLFANVSEKELGELEKELSETKPDRTAAKEILLKMKEKHTQGAGKSLR